MEGKKLEKKENNVATDNLAENTTKLKVCGIRSIIEINELKTLDIDYFGCIFAESRRQVDSELATKITRIAHRHGKRTVGVFVNAMIENVVKIVEETDIDVVQLHGDESVEYCMELTQKLEKLYEKNCFRKRKNFPAKTKLWKVFGVTDELPNITDYKPYIEYPLFDAKGVNRGGNGIVFDWNILKKLEKYSFVLAGGLSIENIQKALDYKPTILDINSKVEVNNRKSKKLVENVVNLVKKNNNNSKRLIWKEKNMENKHFNEKAYFGQFGGQFVPETAMFALSELETEYEKLKNDKEFFEEFDNLLKNYVGRETPLYYAKNLSEHYNHDIYLKREDLNHTGAHKINNALGQVLLAKKMGKKKVIAETGAGQHGVATATAAALLGLECDVYMGAVDIERQKLNVFRMELLGARVISIEDGLKTLKEATTAAIQSWVAEIETVFYVIGSVVGPHPYPTIVRDFQSIIGYEAKAQLEELGKHADHVIACVGGGSNAIGIFSAFLEDSSTKLYGVEAGGYGIDTDMHAATLTLGKPGIIHGMKTYVLQNKYGQISPVHSISAGLDYPGVGPEHSHLFDTKRATYAPITDDEAMKALMLVTRKEGIIPAIESSHALAYLKKLCPTLSKDKRETIIVNVSGRGDKDMHTVFSVLKDKETDGKNGIYELNGGLENEWKKFR